MANGVSVMVRKNRETVNRNVRNLGGESQHVIHLVCHRHEACLNHSPQELRKTKRAEQKLQALLYR
jgi:hypothetical protein